MKKKKGMVVVVVALLLVLITGGVVTLTRSRYQSTAKGTDTVSVAPWVVKVNGTNVVENNTFTANQITWADNDYISDGYIAPGRTGSFDIVIDPTGSKVAMEYSVSVDKTQLASYPNITITSVKLGETVLTADSNGNYTGTISLAEVEANTKKTITVTIAWENKESNNATDTNYGKDAGEFSIPVTVTVSQKIS